MKKKLKLKHWIGIGVLALLILIIVVAGSSNDEEEDQKAQVVPVQQEETQEKPQEQSQKEPEETKGEELFGLTENQRKEILRELILCEDSADREASRYYLFGCENCPEFIKFDVNKFAEKTQELTEICKEELRNKYNITKETEIKIGVEGIEKGWKWLEPLPMPACCK